MPKWPSHRAKETVIKWTVMSCVTVKGININIVYLTTNTKPTGFMTRTLQPALPEGAEPFPYIKSHTYGTRSGVLQLLLEATKARDMQLWEMAVIRDFSIIIWSSHSQLAQIGMQTTNVGIEDTNPFVRTWTQIWLDIATNNQQQMLFAYFHCI